MICHLIEIWYIIISNLEKCKWLMYDYSPVGKNWYKLLTMVVANLPEIFQQKMNDLYHGFKFIRAYIDDHLIWTKLDWTDHVQKLELSLNKMKEKRLKWNIEKSFFRQTNIKYLGFWITCDGFKTIYRNMDAITNINTPTSIKQVRKFISVMTYYRNM